MLRAYACGYRITEGGDLAGPCGQIINGGENRSGYRWFRVRNTDSPIRFHRLQAFQKYGELMFAPGIQVRHLNGNKTDNRPENIAIGTAQENAMDKPAEVRRRAALIATTAAMRHDHSAVVAYLNEGHSYTQTMQRFGIKSKGTISFIARKSRESRARQHAASVHAHAVADFYAEDGK